MPFLFVSGAIGDEVAVESLKSGATDYVLKDRIAKLVPSIRRALEEAEERARHKQVAEELRRGEEKYRNLVNSVDGIVWQAELSSLRFTFVSPQAERLLGYPVSCWLEEADFWQNHIHPEDRERAANVCRQLTREQRYASFEYRMLAANGEIVWLRDIVSIRLEGVETPQIQGIIVNITARKQAEAARRDVQAKLERTNKVLSQRNQEIQNFYHTLSHELKTPLTSAREFVSIVIDGLAGPLNQTQLDYLRIVPNSVFMMRILYLCQRVPYPPNRGDKIATYHHIRHLTRLETGKLVLDFKPISVVALVERVVASLSRMAAEKSIFLRHEVESGLPDAAMDERRMTQVMMNLVSNAIKHTPAAGTIIIEACQAPGRPELLQFSVRDTGCGIAKEEQERIFDRLYQVKAGDATTEEGIGLGLYLCRELVQLHGGTIWVESEPGRGSTFSFVLPKSQQLLRAEVLVVDDDPDLREMLRQLLVAEQYNVRTARNGREGLQEMRRQAPDIVLLDLAMPELTGAAALKEIRKDWGQIPVILHTAFADGELMKQALTSSPFTLLAKPCSPEQILETVRKVQRSGDTEIWKKNHFGLERPPSD